MENFSLLMSGFGTALTPFHIALMVGGVLMGLVVGVLPGLGAPNGVSLMIPLTFSLDPTSAIILLSSMYWGALFGGSTTSILINTPGESASMVTALEGNKMAKAGRAGPALATAAIGSFVAGTIATLGIVFLAPWLVNVAVNFGPEDYFALMCLAFVTVSATFGDSPIRGLTSLLIGLTLGLVGIDKLTGQPRLSFGVPDLLDGVEVTTLAVGLFAVGEALYVASRRHLVEEKLEPVRGSLWMTAADWKRSWKPWIRGTLFGFPIGALITFGAASELFYPGTHGSTFGGNALATAVSTAVLGEIERAGLVENAAVRGDQLREAIDAIGSSLVDGCRGRGLLIGVSLRHPVAGAVVAAAQQHGLIVNAANDATVRIAPALTIGDVEIDEFIDAGIRWRKNTEG